MKDGNKKRIITVSLPSDLIEIMECGKFYNRSAVIAEAMERYLQVREPVLYDMLLAHRREDLAHG